MVPTVIEGTWEEVTRRAKELSGHRVRVTVLDGLAGSKAANGTSAEEAFKRLLLESGLVSQLPEATASSADDDDDAPVVIAGEPLSETILRERR